MNLIYNQPELLKLLSNFATLVDIKISLKGDPDNELLVTKDSHPFCMCIQNTDIGYKGCLECDSSALDAARATMKPYMYRCHAGLLEVCIPIIENQTVIAYLMFGQILDDSEKSQQWKRTQRLCHWYEDIDSLRESFFTIKQFSEEEINACANIISACTEYIWFRELVRLSEPNPIQKILQYIEDNYTRSVKLDEMSSHLHIGKTRLCTLVKKQVGKTINQIVLEKRMLKAEQYLQTTDLPIYIIAEMVGIDDASYFAKLYKSFFGVSPAVCQKGKRHSI